MAKNTTSQWPLYLKCLSRVMVNSYFSFIKVGNQILVKDLDFVRLNLDPLATTIQANARAWVKELGKILNDSAREDLNALKGEIEVSLRGSV